MEVKEIRWMTPHIQSIKQQLSYRHQNALFKFLIKLVSLKFKSTEVEFY